jgi:hypothetical protein
MDMVTFGTRLRRYLYDEFLVHESIEFPSGRVRRNFPGVEWRSLEVDMRDGDFDLVATFLDERRPDCLLGYRWANVWSRWTPDVLPEDHQLPDGIPAESFVTDDTVQSTATIMWANLDEDLYAGDAPPLPPCDGRSVAWLN